MADILASREAVQSSAAEEAPSLVQAIWRKRWLVLACVVVAGALGFMLSSLQAPTYTAKTRVLFSTSQDFDPINGGSFGAEPGRYMANQMEVAQSSAVLQGVIDELRLRTTPVQLRETLKLSASAESNVMSIEAEAADPSLAARVSDSVASHYRQFAQQAVAERANAAAGKTTIPADRARIRAAEAAFGDGVLAVDNAFVPISPSGPQTILSGLVLALVGFLLAAGYALYSQSWTKRRVGPAEASAIFGAPLLSEIPERGRISGPEDIAAAHSDPGDAYRMAAVGLDYIRGTAPGVFLVTAPHYGAGSTTTAMNLAAAAADHGRRAFVIAIEDGTRPHPAENDQRPRVLLHDLTQGRVDLASVMESREASRERFGVLRVLVVEPVQGHPVGDVQQVLDQLPDDTDLVVIDSPPLPSSSASFVLAGQVDAVVVVIDATTTPANLEELQRRCRLAGVTVAGVIRNRIRRSAGEGLFGLRRSGVHQRTARREHHDTTSPRGVPVLTGGTEVAEGGLHVPYPAPESAVPSAARATTVSMPVGAAGGSPPPVGVATRPSPGPPGRPSPAGGSNGPAPAAPGGPGRTVPSTDLPWSSLTRLGPAGSGGPAGQPGTATQQRTSAPARPNGSAAPAADQAGGDAEGEAATADRSAPNKDR